MDKRDQDAVEEDRMMYGHDIVPNKPVNHSKTLPFRELFLTLFNPLNENKKKPTGPVAARKKTGPNGPGNSPNEIRRQIIDRFISRWRKETGNDIYPAFRLIVPEMDRDRAMYGLKELTLGKLFVRIMKIDKNSEDGYNLLHWKLPGVKSSSAMAGDFAGRCFEVISKRAMRTSPGDMTIAEVNQLLDRLSIAQKESNQIPIIEEFYNRMNAEELTWLIRMILRQMKVGATEKTFFDIWHPDAENLFNISSSLKRVCWELSDKEVRLEGEQRGINLMQCFQPQLAAFQMKSMEYTVSRMGLTEEDPTFWIEEKLDGERMQIHMVDDDEIPGGKRFAFWSRKAKDYTYLYGNGFKDENGAMTRHLKEAFNEGVCNIILDGEMVTWDPNEDKQVAFGTLKTAALSEQQNPYAAGHRPLFRVFDCLYLNDVDLTRYTLRKRREALTASVTSIHRRFELHEYTEARQKSEIDVLLRKVVAASTEGLVIKNPRSEYRLNERNDDWIKVKPEYMTEFGEALDCVVVGGYYGSGKRGGMLSSFMCGLRADESNASQGGNPQKCQSFFKVGGGFTALDYAAIRHRTDGKWIDWDMSRPPTEYIELAGGQRQFEKPDVWIRPEDSVVLSVKAGSVVSTDQFRTGLTLRFPRFKKLRDDKDWKSALTFSEFHTLKAQVENEREEKQFKVDDARRKGKTTKRKREIVIQGRENMTIKTPYNGPATKVFQGINFHIMTDAQKPIKKSKAELEQLVTANGGNAVASDKHPETILIAERNVVKVASLQKKGLRNLIRPNWLLECVKQGELDVGKPSFLLPLEPHHLFFTTEQDAGKFDQNLDEYGDSYAKDVTSDELLAIFKKMPSKLGGGAKSSAFLEQLNDHGNQLDNMPGWMFTGVKVYCDNAPADITRLLTFAGAEIALSIEASAITHIVVGGTDSTRLQELRKTISSRSRIPRLVSSAWVHDSWREKTRLDEERESIHSPQRLFGRSLIFSQPIPRCD